MPDRLWGQLLLQLVLIAVNAFFAATEIAVISLNDKKIRKLAEGGDKEASKMLRMVEHPDSFLSTIQVGITLAGFLGSAFAANNFAGRLRDWLVYDVGVTFISPETITTIAVIFITLLLSFLTLVLGELVPKRIAMKRAEAVASGAAGVIRFTAALMKPVVWLLSATTNGALRLLGFDPHDDGEEVTEEEIRLMVDAGEEKGAIESAEKELIENVFEFNNLTAADVMTHRTEMTALWIGDPEDEITDAIIKSGFSRFPVYDEDIDNIVGILSTRQFLLNMRSTVRKPIRELLFPPYFVPETVRADAMFRDMQQKKIHIAIVLDEYGGTSGLVTMEDLLETIAPIRVKLRSPMSPKNREGSFLRPFWPLPSESVRYSRFIARVSATKQRRRSSSSPACLRSSIVRPEGNMPSVMPTTKQTGNSSPFAAWMVISLTRSTASSRFSSLARSSCARYAFIGMNSPGMLSCSVVLPYSRSLSSVIFLNSARLSNRSILPDSRMYRS